MTLRRELLAAQLRRDPGRPLLTWYDEGTGERVELSVTTYANWVAKAASLLVEEHDLERGDVLLVDLPSHWLGPVFLGAAWTAGLAVAFPSSVVTPTAVVCGPASLATWAPRADDLPVLACSLLPMGVRFAEPLPPGVHDVGVEVWGQPDAFTPYDPPEGSDVALVDGPVTQDELFGSSVAAGSSRTRPAATGSCRRRTRLPHQVSPPSRGRSCRAARWSSWRGRTRPGSTRSPRPSGSPTARADQPAPGDVRAGRRPLASTGARAWVVLRRSATRRLGGRSAAARARSRTCRPPRPPSLVGRHRDRGLGDPLARSDADHVERDHPGRRHQRHDHHTERQQLLARGDVASARRRHSGLLLCGGRSHDAQLSHASQGQR